MSNMRRYDRVTLTVEDYIRSVDRYLRGELSLSIVEGVREALHRRCAQLAAIQIAAEQVYKDALPEVGKPRRLDIARATGMSIAAGATDEGAAAVEILYVLEELASHKTATTALSLLFRGRTDD